MNRRRVKELLPIIESYLIGNEVQIKIMDIWRDVTSISDFASFNNEFRIKSEPKLVPFTFEDRDLFKDKWFKRKGQYSLQKPSGIYDKGMSLHLQNGWSTYSFILENYEFEDGSPCGKYVEE